MRRNPKHNPAQIATLAAILIAVACSGPQGTEPDDMSAKEHREHAAHERSKADKHARKYNPKAQTTEIPGPVGSAGGIYDFPLHVYNPTEQHTDHAAHYRRLAAEHLAAAKALEAFEQGACHRFPPKTRSACPVRGPIVNYEEIPGGVRLKVAKGVPIAALKAHAQCHFAFGRARGFAQMPNCPLYIAGLKLRADAAGRTIELTTDVASKVAELRRRAATHAVSK